MTESRRHTADVPGGGPMEPQDLHDAGTDWPHFEEDEIEAVAAVLASGRVNYWTGHEVRAFEREFADYCGANHAVAVANGSVALELALRALGIGAGEEVVVTPRTFVASASAVVLCGARPVFADVDPVSQNVTAGTISQAITPRTRAVITVHLAGWPCDMDDILALAEERGLHVIEDCAQAHGAAYRGRRVGSFGDAAAFSFCNDKIMSTGGEGGMLLLKDEQAWQRAWSYKDHGKSYAAVNDRHPKPDFRWVHESFGTNWRMTEVQGALGRIQLRKLPRWLQRRRQNAAALTEALRPLPGVRVTDPPPEVEHAYYKYYAFLRPERLHLGWSRDAVIETIAAQGTPCFSGSCSEVYLEKSFRDAGLQPHERLPVARELGETSLMFPVHPTLSAGDMERTSRVARDVLGRATS